MATIRAYTTIEQSRKLAEILPLESADMFYDGYKDVLGNGEISYQIDVISNWTAAYPNKNLFEKSDDATIPSWSLAALLSVIPYPTLHRTINGWRCDMYHKKGRISQFGEDSDNPIDTCYEMIIKLHELNLL